MGGSHSIDQYCVPVEGTKANAKETCIYRNPNGLKGLPERPEEEVGTVQDLYRMVGKRYASKGYLGSRKIQKDGRLGGYEYLSYGECLEIATNLGSSIIEKKLVERLREYQDLELQLIGVYAKNREEWILLDEACTLYGFTLVPVYDTLGQEAVQYIYEQSNIITICLTANYVSDLIKQSKAKKTGRIQNVILFDPENLKEDVRRAAEEEVGLRIYNFKDLVEQGKSCRHEYAVVKPDDIYTFSYTSGTTGLPKAAMITHKNMVSTVAGASLHKNLHLNDQTAYLSYLPLAHVLERIAFIVVTYFGGYCGFYSGDTLKIKDDIQELKPTMFASVPRLFNRFHDIIKGKFDNLKGIKKSLLERGLRTKLYNLRNYGTVTHRIYDALIFNKVKAEFGGRINLLVTGGAPLSGEVADFLKVCLCSNLVEGYGQTESTGASFGSVSERYTAHIGGPLAQTEFKIRNVDEMEYTVDDKDEQNRPQPRGEILIRGPGVIRGYYKDPEKTREAIDEDGWLASGDIVKLDYEGRIKIIDRKKNILKLQQGEYVAPEKIEGVYVRNKLISEIFVYGDSTQSHLVGIVIPDQKNFEEFAKNNNITGNYTELCNNTQLKNLLQKEFDKFSKAEGLYGFEQIKAFHLDTTPFLTNELYTPSFKIKRNVAKKFYLPILQELYKQPVGK